MGKRLGGERPEIVPLDVPWDQFQAYRRISVGHSHSFLFESLAGPDVLAETSVMGFDPGTILRGYADRVEIDRDGGGTKTVRTADPFGELKRLLEEHGAAAAGGPECPYRYLGGAVGVVNYDAVRLVEDIPDAHGAPQPLMEFGIYDDGLIYDNRSKTLSYFYYGGKDRSGRLGVGAGAAAAGGGDNNSSSNSNSNSGGPRGAFSCSNVRPNMGVQEYSEMVRRAKAYIHDGDAFQVVLSRRFDFDVGRGDTLALYGALRRLNPSPYMYHLRQGRKAVIGASPEMLVRVTGDRVETFPIAGTRKITGDDARDGRLGEELLGDEKELAEHTMLVDLGRNDIGRVCRPGTVRPESLMQIVRFSHVQHIVTHVAGALDPGRDMFDAFRAVFPAGTVSGAPKVRAMEIIDELEPVSRGPYAGAVGYFSYNGCCDFAIAIRSIFVDGGAGFVQAGAGIVADADPASEFLETEHKAGAMLEALRDATAEAEAAAAGTTAAAAGGAR